jgi:hypothetical protein
VCTPAFVGSSAVIERVGSGLVALPGEAETGTGEADLRLEVWIVGNGWRPLLLVCDCADEGVVGLAVLEELPLRARYSCTLS